MARNRASLPTTVPRRDRPAQRWALLAVPTAAIFLAAGTSTGAAAAASSPAAPDAAALQAALLTAGDLGPGFSSPTDTSTDDPTTITGCDALDPLLNGTGTTTAGQDQEGTNIQADGDNGPFVNEGLLAEAPAKVAADYARDTAALKSCKTLSMTSDGTTLDFKLSPINFAPAGSTTAVRMDGTLDGVETNGYLAVGNLGDVEVEYFYLQFDDGSSQLASYYFTKAFNKAQTTLNSAAGGGGSGGGSGSGPTPGGSGSPSATPSPVAPGSGGVAAAPRLLGQMP